MLHCYPLGNKFESHYTYTYTHLHTYIHANDKQKPHLKFEGRNTRFPNQQNIRNIIDRFIYCIVCVYFLSLFFFRYSSSSLISLDEVMSCWCCCLNLCCVVLCCVVLLKNCFEAGNALSAPCSPSFSKEPNQKEINEKQNLYRKRRQKKKRNSREEKGEKKYQKQSA